MSEFIDYTCFYPDLAPPTPSEPMFAVVGSNFDVPRNRPTNQVDFASSPDCLSRLLQGALKPASIYYAFPYADIVKCSDVPTECEDFERVAREAHIEPLPIPEHTVRRTKPFIGFEEAATLLAVTSDALRKRARKGDITAIQTDQGRKMLNGFEIAELRRQYLLKINASESPRIPMIHGLINIILDDPEIPIIQTQDPRTHAHVLVMLTSKSG